MAALDPSDTVFKLSDVSAIVNGTVPGLNNAGSAVNGSTDMISRSMRA